MAIGIGDNCRVVGRLHAPFNLEALHTGIHKLGKELTGPEYANVYREMVCQRNIKVYYGTTVLSIDGSKTVTASSDEGFIRIKATAIVLAMGCRERSGGAIGICGSRPAGIYSAGTAQRLINCEGYLVGKRAVILGSGDIGLIMARRLTLQGIKVEAVCEIMSYSSGLARNISQCLDDFEIPLLLNTTVVQVHGTKRLEGVTVASVDENRNILPQSKRYIPCDTLLLSVGLIPENEICEDANIALDKITGGAVVDQHRQTDIEGVFACGNVLHVHDLVDCVSDEAEIAGRSAALYCANKLVTEKDEKISVNAGKNVRYVVPHMLTDNSDVTLYFRTNKPMDNARITVFADGKPLIQGKAGVFSPGEMEKLTLTASKLQGIKNNVTVCVEEL